jgi:hypothetical protein
MHAARSTVSAQEARLVGAVSGALGHLALVIVIGAVFTVGFPLLFPSDDEPSQTQQECERNFGAGAAICAEQDQASDAPRVRWGDVAKAGIGLVPAGLTGALVATIMTPPRKRR